MNRFLAPNSLYQSMVMRNINHGILQNDFTGQGVIGLVITYAIGRCLNLGEKVITPTLATLVGLELCNGFDAATYLDQANGRIMFRNAIHQLVHTIYPADGYAGINFIAIPDDITNAMGSALPAANLAEAVVNFRSIRNNDRGIAFDAYYNVALLLATYITQNVIGGPSIVVAQVAGVMRRGALTEAWAQKYIEGVKDELGIKLMSNEHLIEVAKNTWTRLGPVLDSRTAATLITRWNEIIPAHAIRLRATITQAQWAGMTALIVIGRSMVIFPDFLWDNINNAFPMEIAAFFNAVTLVGEDAYLTEI